MNKKSILLVGLFILLIASLVACGSNSTNTDVYVNDSNSNITIDLTKNDDGTYGVFFTEISDVSFGGMGGKAEMYPIQLDSVECVNNIIRYEGFSSDNVLEIHLYDGYLTIEPEKALGHDNYVGRYTKK